MIESTHTDRYKKALYLILNLKQYLQVHFGEDAQVFRNVRSDSLIVTVSLTTTEESYNSQASTYQIIFSTNLIGCHLK